VVVVLVILQSIDATEVTTSVFKTLLYLVPEALSGRVTVRIRREASVHTLWCERLCLVWALPRMLPVLLCRILW